MLWLRFPSVICLQPPEYNATNEPTIILWELRWRAYANLIRTFELQKSCCSGIHEWIRQDCTHACIRILNTWRKQICSAPEGRPNSPAQQPRNHFRFTIAVDVYCTACGVFASAFVTETNRWSQFCAQILRILPIWDLSYSKINSYLIGSNFGEPSPILEGQFPSTRHHAWHDHIFF